MKRYWIFRGLKFFAFASVAVLVFGFVVMTLWNWVVPAITGFESVSFFQALALLILARLLFGGFRGFGGGGRWRHRMRNRWAQMTPEERERFRACRPATASPNSGSEETN